MWNTLVIVGLVCFILGMFMALSFTSGGGRGRY